MNLSKEKLERLNVLLRNSNIDVPDFRRTVTESGANYEWLKKHILVRNKISDELRSLLNL